MTTTQKIRQLRIEAIQAGDYEMADTCNVAIFSDDEEAFDHSMSVNNGRG